MKRIIKALVYYLVASGLFYLVLIFIGLPINIMDWTELQKGVFLGMSAFYAFILYGLVEGTI